MSFPKEFPKGRFGYNTPRDTKLSIKKYFNTRFLNSDEIFTNNTSYIFYAQYVTEASQILQTINIALRKKSPCMSLYGRCATVKDITDNDSSTNLLVMMMASELGKLRGRKCSMIVQQRFVSLVHILSSLHFQSQNSDGRKLFKSSRSNMENP